MNNEDCVDDKMWCGDGAGNTVEENSSVLSLIQMHWLSARACGQ